MTASNTTGRLHMHSSSHRSRIKSDIPDTPSRSRKRKQANEQCRLERPNPPQAPHLPHSNNSNTLANDLPTASAHKRLRVEKEDSSQKPSRNALAGEMYAFASRTPNSSSNGVIDLTAACAPSSPAARRTTAAMKLQPGRNAINAHTGAKKLVVKNLKSNTQWDSKAYLEKTWSTLDAALEIIFQNLQQHFSKEDLYRGVENVCRQGAASSLFTRLEGRCKTHMEMVTRDALLTKTDLQSNVQVLDAVIAQWSTWKEQMAIIHAIFFFMDRSYLLSSSRPTLSELTPQLFRDYVFYDAALKDRIVLGACDLVAANRSKHSTSDQSLFRKAIEMFHDLSVYSSNFEPKFLGTSQDYIDHWSHTASTTHTVAQYVEQSEECIAREMARCEDFALTAGTKRELLSLLEDHLVVRKQAYLTGYEGLATMLDQSSIKDLTALYGLLKRRRIGNTLRPAFEKWVDQTGTDIVFAEQSDDMVVHLLSLQRRLDTVWRTGFQRDENLGHGLRESFEAFMNKTKKGESTWGTDNTKVGEMIAKYVDTLLRGGAKAIPETLTTRRSSSIAALPSKSSHIIASRNEDNEDDTVDEDAEVNSQLDQVLDLFRFVHGKAVFEAFYKKDLARRLLMGRSASADAERSMLTRLKTECGSGFTQNLEQMFKDIELAREEMQSYKQRLQDRIGYEKGKSIDLSVNVLSAAAWPTYPDISVVIPQDVKRSIDDFELHYKSKHSGRKLDWKHALAHCQMRATFNKGSKEFIVSSFQAVVLLLFNNLQQSDTLAYSHILSESGLPEPEVKRTLQSLACAKLRPLSKHPKGRDINTTDTFTINQDFEHPKYRVKINQVQLKETKEENKETHIRVAEDRNFECQAAIVRIMKSRKTIGHSELVSEVIKATMNRGVLAVADIKKNIDRLIEKDYMEREDGGGYSYVA